MQNQKFILLSFLVGAVFLAVSVTGLVVPLLARLEVGDPVLLGMNASSIGGVIVGLGTFFALARNAKATGFTDEVIAEVRKVVWPDREETVRSTAVVLAFTLVVAGALAVYDYVWAGVTSELLYTEG
jgi:preprotein translocase subunit SecE